MLLGADREKIDGPYEQSLTDRGIVRIKDIMSRLRRGLDDRFHETCIMEPMD
jgi:hypothetical protein